MQANRTEDPPASDLLNVKRMTIPIMQDLQWSTDVLQNVSDLVDGFSAAEEQERELELPLTAFFSSLYAYERSLLTKKGNSQAIHDMQKRLGIRVDFRTGEVARLSVVEPWTNPDASKACSLLCAYRLVDYCALLRGVHPAESPRIPRSEIPRVDYLPEIVNRMKSWKKVLLDFRSQMRLARQVQESSAESMWVDKPHAHQRLFHFSAAMHTINQKIGVLQNLAIAAGHIALLKDTIFSSGQIPDIPDDFLQKNRPLGTGLENIESNFIEYLGSNAAGVSCLRSVLQIGLFVSLVCLVHPTPLAKKKGYDRKQLIGTWAALGSAKPPLLVEVELHILRILLKMAFGSLTPFEGAESLLSTLPWDAIQDVSDEDDGWFILDSEPQTRPEPKMGGSSNSRLLIEHPGAEVQIADVDMDADVDADGDAECDGDVVLTFNDNDGVTGPAVEGNQEHDVMNIDADQSGTREDVAGDKPLDPQGSSSLPSRKSARLASGVLGKTVPSQPSKPEFKPKPKAKPKRTRKSTTSNSAGSSIFNPIDVDSLFNIGIGPFEPKPEPDLDTDSKPARIPANYKIDAYGPRGEVFEFQPIFHFNDVHEDFRGFWKAVEDNYHDNVPNHVHPHRKEQSMFAVMTEEEFNAKSYDEIAGIFSTQHIVMDKASTTRFQFDAKGLRHTSIKAKADNTESRTINGTLQQVLDSVADPEGKFINCLDFPGSESGIPLNEYATDLVAWYYTRGAKGYQATTEYPRAHMRWHLVSTGNTVSWVHIDSDGLCSEIVVICGKKLWIMGGPKKNYTLADVMMYLRKDFYVEVPPADCVWEAIVLTPGTRLLMRPNTPHAVFTPEPTICEGGHFYTTSLLTETAIGMIHSFICNKRITNTIHDPARALLRRIAEFWYEGLVRGSVEEDSPEYDHLVDWTNFSSVLNFLSLCNMVILANALDPRTYLAPNQKPEQEASESGKRNMEEFDLNSIGPLERLEMIHARGICVHLLHWFECNIEITDAKTGQRISNVAGYYLGQQAGTILAYKKLAFQRSRKIEVGVPHCTPQMLDEQLRNALSVWDDALQHYDTPSSAPLRLDFHTEDGRYNIYYLNKPELDIGDGNDEDLIRDYGTTPFDEKYFQVRQSKPASTSEKPEEPVISAENERGGKRRKL